MEDGTDHASTDPGIVVERIGEERQPVAIVDGFHPDPDALRAHAIAQSFEPARNHYPGIRAALPHDYLAAVGPKLLPVLREVFGAGTGVEAIDASFSIVATPREALTVAQRLPHVDAVERGRIALVHYLSPDGGDGTAFFRHRATRYEQVSSARAPTYRHRLAAELRDGGAPAPGYVAGSTPLFERTALVDGVYNRAVIYPSALLHSGAIAADAALCADPATGRLTVTAFFLVR